MRLRLVDDSPDARSVGPIAVRGRTTLPSGARSRGLCAGPPTRRSDTRGRLRLPAGMHQIAPCARASCARLSETRGGLPLPAGMRGVAGCARLLGHGTVVPARVHGEGQGLLAEDGRRLQGGARMLPRLPRRARGRRQGRGRVRPLRARLLQNLDRVDARVQGICAEDDRAEDDRRSVVPLLVRQRGHHAHGALRRHQGDTPAEGAQEAR